MQTDRHTDRQTDGKTDRQTDGKTDGQTHTPGVLYAAEVGVLLISAPSAFSTATFSLLIFSGITITHL